MSDNSSQQEIRRSRLRSAIAALKPSVTAAARYIGDLSSALAATKQQQQGGEKSNTQVDALADLYVESQLLLLDCIEDLVASLEGQEGSGPEQERLSQLADEVLTQISV